MAEASRDRRGQQVITSIGFAQRWLDRAKRQCLDGDVSRGLLTLVLASAEMGHALRMPAPTGALRRRRVVPAIALGTAAALAFAALAAWQGGPPAPAPSAPAPAIVTFSLSSLQARSTGLTACPQETPAGASIGGSFAVRPPCAAGPLRGQNRWAATYSSRVGTLLEPMQVLPVQMTISPVGQTVTAQATRRPARATPPMRVDAPADAARSVPDVPTPVAGAPPVPVSRPAAALSSLPAGTVGESGLTDGELIDLVLAAERILRTPSRP